MIEKLSNLPNPWQILNDPASIIVIGIFLCLMVAEAVFPGRPLPKIRYWKLKGIVAFVVYFFLSSYLPLIWNDFLSGYQIIDMSGLGDYWGALVALLIYEFGVYVWHRAMHKNNVLWRVFHQMHHSAERVDTYGTFFFSPMDMIGFTFLTSLALVWIGGFTPQATIYAIYGATFLAVIQHTNIRTPQWMGYIFQRPESHSVHHEKGVHAFNYSDLPLFDILLGTFRNPKEFAHETGFYDGASGKIGAMMLFRDVNKG
ncbi:sterol desaturase family protein [Flavobacterium sp. MAH-1]|uniref:Sterol desaturase family protein n=1 Tax=Flavobacterium agri TaxID=2743471 RepID=A0A7Y9C3Z3_9FLAO|nr:sterol desaturase family protein [Flavobacterium agri]NUY79606.1 sterol desaturase family protein [Flavobacterium agri]NYA69631.1 sterol desaturase family protein [Flavobacterium agri]